jgi:hypothetical protein
MQQRVAESVLFAAHGGHIGTRFGTICGPDSCLPIAFSRNSDAPGGEHGLHNLWEEHCVPHEFFGDDPYSGIGLPHFRCPRAGGIYVYDVEWILGDDGWPTVDVCATGVCGFEDDDDPTLHLRGGSVRRPTPNELKAIGLGTCPWEGGVLL